MRYGACGSPLQLHMRILKKNPSLTVKWASLDVTVLQSTQISLTGLMITDEAKCLSPPPKSLGISSPSSALMEMGRLHQT